jgi:hypothetical protein
MGKAYVKAVSTHLTNAEIVFDHFYVFAIANKAVGQIRRESVNKAQGEEKKPLKSSKYIILLNPENLTNLKKQQNSCSSLLAVSQYQSRTYRLWPGGYRGGGIVQGLGWNPILPKIRPPSAPQTAVGGCSRATRYHPTHKSSRLPEGPTDRFKCAANPLLRLTPMVSLSLWASIGFSRCFSPTSRQRAKDSRSLWA